MNVLSETSDRCLVSTCPHPPIVECVDKTTPTRRHLDCHPPSSNRQNIPIPPGYKIREVLPTCIQLPLSTTVHCPVDLCSTSKMHLATIPLLLTLFPSTLATHSPPGPFPFSLPFNTTGTLTNLTLPTGPPPRLPAWHPWTPGPARGRGRLRHRPGRVFSPTLNNTLTPANTTLTTLPTMIPPTSLQYYRITTGSISCTSTTGLISKSPSSPESDTSVLASFQLPGAARNKTCQLFFYLPTTNETEVSEGGTSPPFPPYFGGSS